MTLLNDYNNISGEYKKTDVKPDKQYSTLPTVLKIMGSVEGKIVLDLGCGGGFFTNAIARQGATMVFGVDNSEEQIKLANLGQSVNTKFVLGDIFEDELPSAGIVLAPYVVNYATDIYRLDKLFKNIFESTEPGGKLVAVVDLPEGGDLKKFGAIKTVLGNKEDGANIEIQLFNDDEFICLLHSVYFSPRTLEKVLLENGFVDISWHLPTVSKEGIKKFGTEFWSGYVKSSELGFLEAHKPLRT